MHAISYQLKRCHLSAVALGRRILRGKRGSTDPKLEGVPDMTPARFDILFLTLGTKMPELPAPGAITMMSLRKTLGLARPTISKAVKRLVELGLVTCELLPGSERFKVVALTKEGEARIKRAMHLVFTGRRLARHYRRFIAKELDPPFRSPKQFPDYINGELFELWTGFRNLARHLFDRSDFLYDRQLRHPFG